MAENKPFCIPKWAVLRAWAKVRDNKGAAGVDGVSIEDFEKKLKNNLYRIMRLWHFAPTTHSAPGN